MAVTFEGFDFYSFLDAFSKVADTPGCAVRRVEDCGMDGYDQTNEQERTGTTVVLSPRFKRGFGMRRTNIGKGRVDWLTVDDPRFNKQRGIRGRR